MSPNSIPSGKEIKHILKQVAAGKETAFRRLFDCYHEKVYSFALYFTHSEIMAEEITQEIFIKIWTHRHQLNEINYFKSWLNTLVKNQAYNTLRRLATESRILKELKDQSLHHSEDTDPAIQEAGYALLREAIDRLPPRQKEVYLLSRRQGMKHAAIAESMNISVNTVKNHIKAALRSIKIYLEDHKEALTLMIIFILLL